MLLLSNLQAAAEVQNTDILLGQVGQSLSSTLIVELVTEKKARVSSWLQNYNRSQRKSHNTLPLFSHASPGTYRCIKGNTLYPEHLLP